MTHYHISYQNPFSQFIQIRVDFQIDNAQTTKIALATWRPGRYEVQHFAKRIRKLRMVNHEGKELKFYKSDLSEWTLPPQNQNNITVTYEYHAALMDAGNTWLAPDQIYINPINCFVYIEEQRNRACQVTFDLPDDYKIATGLEHKDHICHAPSFHILVDSPMIASNSLRKVTYQVDQKIFNLWFQGHMPRTDQELQKDFEAFTKKTIEIMGDLPCENYHFLNQILPYQHYHGVEHWNSTVITIGPSEALGDRTRYADFLGVSCHELFHTWNVIRLRPIEMTPYDFQGPNLHTTGFITEGITTYYGDLILARSGVYSFEEYINEVNKLLQRHFSNEGRKNYSVAESSFDLWLDGYEKGIPGRKVSIYNEGALAALILDLMIRDKFENKRSLDDVMRLMWQRHGKGMKGYRASDYRLAAENIYEKDLSHYFDKILFGREPFENLLKSLFHQFGLRMTTKYPDNEIEKDYGFKMNAEQVIIDIDNESPAYTSFMLKDKITEIKKVEGSLELKVERYGASLDIKIQKAEEPCFEWFEVEPIKSMATKQESYIKAWLENASA